MAQGKSWQRLNWQDPFLLEQQLTDEQRMVRDSAHQYAQEKLLPRVQDAFRREETDPVIFCEMGELILAANPRIMDAKHAEPIPGRVQVLELP